MIVYCKDCKYFGVYHCRKEILRGVDPVTGGRMYYTPDVDSEEKNKYNSCIYFEEKGKFNYKDLIKKLLYGFEIAFIVIRIFNVYSCNDTKPKLEYKSSIEIRK